MAKSTRTNTVKKWTLLLLIVCLLAAVIGGTYSRYTSTATQTGSAQVAKWAVKINNKNIVANEKFTVVFNEVKNDNVVDGKIAPSSRLYADFEIDPTGSEVAVDYLFKLGTISAKIGEENATVPTGIEVEKVVYLVDDTENEGQKKDGNKIAQNTDGEYVGETIALESQESALTAASKKIVRVYIVWTNTDTEAENTNHTDAGNKTPTLSMEITGTAKQHI